MKYVFLKEFSFLFHYQRRNTKIAAATDALKRKEIGIKAFLDRVCFADYKLCEHFLEFKNLSESDEDYTQYFIEVQNEMATELVAATQSNMKYCGTCVTSLADCVMVPCGHVYFCVDCFAEWKKVDVSLYDIYVDEDIPESLLLNVESPTLCPICRALVQHGVKPILGDGRNQKISCFFFCCSPIVLHNMHFFMRLMKHKLKSRLNIL